MIEDGSLPLALGAAVALLGGMFAETRLLVRRRWNWYFLPTLPIGWRPVPIPRPPRNSGRTRTVRWELAEPHLVRFWADPTDRTALSGLHGVVLLALGRHGVELDIRWAPPWTPVVAALWLAGLGVVRGEGQLTVPIAVCIVIALLVVYGERAHRVAAELRWSFVQGDDADARSDDDPDGPSGAR